MQKNQTQDQYTAAVFSDRTDVKTLRPMLNTLSRWHQARYEDVVADAGYESLENYLHLEQGGQMRFIKPASYDQMPSPGAMLPGQGPGLAERDRAPENFLGRSGNKAGSRPVCL